MVASVPNREESRSELNHSRCNATEPREVEEKIGSDTLGRSLSDEFLSDPSIVTSKPNPKLDDKRIFMGNAPISCIKTSNRTEIGDVYEKRSSQGKTVRFDITQRSMQFYDNAMENTNIKKKRKKKSRQMKKKAGPVENFRLKNTVHCNKLFERNKEKNAIGKKRREEIKQRIDNAARQKRNFEEERIQKALIDEQRLATLVEAIRRNNKPSPKTKVKGRISAGHARISCITASERNASRKTYEEGASLKKTASVGCSSSKGVRIHETINKRCMRLYDAAMQKIKLKNERKKKVLTDEQMLARLVEQTRRENSVPCIKLYELNKEKNEIGKKTREEIEKRVAKKSRQRSKRVIHEKTECLSPRLLHLYESGQTESLSPRFLHLYESGKQKIRTKRRDEEKEQVARE